MPERPKVGSHVQVRRQVVGEESRVLVHLPERVAQLGEREWAVLRMADGTRDLEGLRLAAARAGVRISLEHVRAFVHELARLGVFEEAPGPDNEPSFARDLPVVPLPAYHFRCDGEGQCCIQYDTILFSPVEEARARALLPELRQAGVDPARMFLPERGLDSPLSVASRVDGGCAYLDAHGRCRLHALAGAEAKPRGCRIFPAQPLDVGDAIRVAPRPECACVFASAGLTEGAPWVDAARGSELPLELYVPRLPARVRVGPEIVDASALVRFCDALTPSGDLAAYCWRLAEGVRAAGLDVREDALPPLDTAAVRAALARVAESAARVEQRVGTWRAPRDGAATGVRWVREALAGLSDGLPEAREPADEALYLRAGLHLALSSRALSSGGPSSREGFDVEGELRERALAMWIGRAFRDEARELREASHPIAIVEAMARGHGLALGS